MDALDRTMEKCVTGLVTQILYPSRCVSCECLRDLRRGIKDPSVTS
jgi:hypothetical protein